ncbi:ketopantoate reductase PanE/ApbA C terminal-domain-containing protein [Aspergillus granulosus]|uniref:Ketopantoate reductase PanE/ApbA C terminal-domain-containing protein n=1 Tax=Aspergillus granulosus TaxID=176169 RepID=A0ABR4H7V6_9EURO
MATPNRHPPRILVVGTGSIGIVYSMILARAGADLSCICRSNHTAATTTGFTVYSTIFGTETFHPGAVYASIDEAIQKSTKPYDFILVTTKAFPSREQGINGSRSSPGSQSETSSSSSSSRPHKPTAIVLIQNGLGIEREYRAHFPHNPIISCVAYLPTTQTAPAVVHHTEVERLQLGMFPGAGSSGEQDPGGPSSCSSSAVTTLAGLLRAGGATAEIHADIQIARWRKLIGNASWNPICALSRCRDLEFLSQTPSSTREAAGRVTTPLAREVVQRVMEEVVSVARAAGYAGDIGVDDVSMQLARSDSRSWPGVEPSMLADVRAGRAMEVEAVLGEVVRVAREVGVEVPRLECLYTLLLGLNWSLRK